MASYLLEVGYTPSALAALMANPQDRTKVVAAAVKKLGGKITGFWFSFGDADIIGILEMPDNTSMAALSIAIGAGGACRTVKTTPLMSVADGIEAMKKAGTCGYKPVTG
jgi:uncharacterized protein with GYD domain